MTQQREFDVIVLGSGPGGEGAAMQAAKAGKRIAVVEKYRAVGGGCTHWATIPSKALREAVRTLKSFRKHPLFEGLLVGKSFTFPQLLQGARRVIDGQVDSIVGSNTRLRCGNLARRRTTPG